MGSRRHRFRWRHDQNARRALEASAQSRDVDGPGEALPGIGRELDLDDNAQHGLSIHEQHDEVGAVLGWIDVGQVGRLDTRLRIGWELDMQGIA
jgi:hypothetical protein